MKGARLGARHAIVVAVGLLWACRGRACSSGIESPGRPKDTSGSEAETRSAQDDGAPAGLRWEPNLDEVLDGDARFQTDAELLDCRGAEDCRRAAIARRGDVARDQRVSPDGLHVVVQLDRGQDAFLHVYDIDSRTGSVCSAGEGFFGSQSADITWTAGNNLLLSWGAGSDVAFIHLLDRYCGELLSVGVTGYNISPDRRYLMTGPATGAPLASDHSVKIFDLESGKQIATRLDKYEYRSVEHVVWQPKSLILHLVEQDGGTATEMVALP